MKLLINFDFWNAVRNVNEPFTPFKLIRNEKNHYVKHLIPIYFLIDIMGHTVPKAIGILIAQMSTLVTTVFLVEKKLLDIDKYKQKSDFDLSNLVSKLKDIDVETDKELIKETTLDSKVYNIKLNEKKLPVLVESKYVLVPSYSFSGDIKDSSLVQEHVVGSHTYILSHGSKQKQLKLAYSNV
jgi:hypothetical protein